MSSPAATVFEDASIVEAGRALTAANVNELVVIDEAGRATGTLTALDVVRGLLGKPLRHPETFPHRDDRFGLTWSNDHELVAAGSSDVPDAPGVLVLFEGASRHEGAMRWIESCSSLRECIEELTSASPAVTTELGLVLEKKGLRYSFALVFDPDRRDAVASELRDTLRGVRRATS